MIVQLTGFNITVVVELLDLPFGWAVVENLFVFFTVLIPAIHFFDAARWPSEESHNCNNHAFILISLI